MPSELAGSATTSGANGALGTGRASHTQEQARRDVEVLEWIARFRFVTAETTATRFGVTVQRMRLRLRRLAAAGFVAGHRASVAEAIAYFLTRQGRLALGLPPRKPPRPDVHRRHELAVVQLVALLEARGSRVLTERECRWAQAQSGAARFSVQTADGRRWPDAVVQGADGRRLALEIEFAAKPTDRLRRIAQGYLAGPYSNVRFLVESPRLAERLATICESARAGASGPLVDAAGLPELEVLPWLDVDAPTRAQLVRGVSAVRARFGRRAAAI